VSQKLLILLPGNPDQADWTMHYAMLLLYLCARFEVVIRGSSGNNIYLVRQLLAKEAAELHPDYVLWIDSDNLVTVEGFQYLHSAAEADPELSIIGGWYFYPTHGGKIKVAAGWNPPTPENMITLERIQAATDLIEVGYIGFGMCLMKGQVFQATRPHHFRPILDDSAPEGFLTDDAGFCQLAREKGYRSYLHPAVFVHHLKVLKVPAPAGLPNQTGEKANGHSGNSSYQQPELQVLDYHSA
jgi:hypothetical protein